MQLIRKMGQVVAGVTPADLEAYWEVLLHMLNTVAARQWQLDTIDSVRTISGQCSLVATLQ